MSCATSQSLFSRPQFVDKSRSNDAIWRQSYLPALPQIMNYCLSSTSPSFVPMVYQQVHPWSLLQLKLNQIKIFLRNEMDLKMSSLKWRLLDPVSICQLFSRHFARSLLLRVPGNIGAGGIDTDLARSGLYFAWCIPHVLLKLIVYDYKTNPYTSDV